MNFYLVFDHYYSGIIQSQVIDLIESLEEQTEEKFKVLVFVNVKRFKEAHAAYANNAARVSVLPNFGFSRWHWSLPFLVFFGLVFRPKVVIGRSIFANQLALKVTNIGLAKEVVLDARGAEYAEWSEYFFKGNEGPVSNEEVFRLEKKSVEESDRLLAVSSQLKAYWRNTLKSEFKDLDSMVIPSTLSKSFTNRPDSWDVRDRVRKTMNVEDHEVLIVFSGSNSDWHSIEKVVAFCDELLEINSDLKFLFLTNAVLETESFPRLKERLIVKWVGQEHVMEYLLASDYGFLIRDDSITNQVSSPVKFAEYLACGNRIIISENIGDFSKLVSEQKLGIVVKDWQITHAIDTFQEEERLRLAEFGYSIFKKSKCLNAYRSVFFGSKA